MIGSTEIRGDLSKRRSGQTLETTRLSSSHGPGRGHRRAGGERRWMPAGSRAACVQDSGHSGAPQNLQLMDCQGGSQGPTPWTFKPGEDPRRDSVASATATHGCGRSRGRSILSPRPPPPAEAAVEKFGEEPRARRTRLHSSAGALRCLDREEDTWTVPGCHSSRGPG